MKTHDDGPSVLTREEAVAVSSGLLYTGGCHLQPNPGTREGCRMAIRRLQLEAAVRDAGGWWDDVPCIQDMYALLGKGHCPDSFEMPAGGVAAIVELLPALIEETEHIAPEEHYIGLKPRIGPMTRFEHEEHEEWRTRFVTYRGALAGLGRRLGAAE
jgi:hypothetical protein